MVKKEKKKKRGEHLKEIPSLVCKKCGSRMVYTIKKGTIVVCRRCGFRSKKKVVE